MEAKAFSSYVVDKAKGEDLEASEKKGRREERERGKGRARKMEIGKEEGGKRRFSLTRAGFDGFQQLLTPPKSSAMSRKEDGQKPGFAWGPTQA